MRRNQLIGIVLGLLVLLLFMMLEPPEGLSKEALLVAGVTVLMAIWWMTEAIPVSVTALLPLALFPLLQILPAAETSRAYGHNLVLILLAGFFIAKAIEVHNLHKRIALVIINLIGTSRKRIILSFMISTALLSMWMSNMAVALLMLPIGIAVIKREEEISVANGNNKFVLALMLAIAYAASIGGIGTPIGTPPNLIFQGIIEDLYPNSPGVSFVEWMAIGVPLILVFLPVIWIYLVKYFKVSGNLPGSSEIIKDELKALGPMTKGEKWVSAIFIFTALGWVFRKDIDFGSFYITGWETWLGVKGYVHDVTIAFVSSILLFTIPVGIRKKGSDKSTLTPLLTWKQAETVPWGVIFLIGGGYAIAAGFKATKLVDWIGDNLSFLEAWPVFVVLVVVILFITFLTEVNSNAATASIFIPVLAAVSTAGNWHPFLLTIPATIACSCSFMLPSGTGTNAVIFGSGRVTIKEMSSAGFILNFIGIVVVTLIAYLIVVPMFGIGQGVPEWAK